ncbi:MAG: phytanoyl-CoA dioxygenase family protein [Chloroflexi bacterium]|nr:phytanoyl-CoA dioxygenase family protein [Chloroflexota bacterium]
MLTLEQVTFFRKNGYLRLERIFSSGEVEQLGKELNYIMETFCTPTKGWTGAWRKDKQYLTPEEEEKSQLTAIHELQHYSPAWARATLKEPLVEAVSDLIGPAVELHHVTLHAKGPEFGTPFPMHQDNPFYPHENGAYVDAIVHVDTTNEENGCLKFLAGSHSLGPLEHIREGSPHLPTDEFRIEDAVSCPAEAGDVVLFSIYTVHGSALNRSPRIRRLVRLGYRDPANRQIGGQAMGRPGLMVHGVRPKLEGVTINPYGLWTQPALAVPAQTTPERTT